MWSSDQSVVASRRPWPSPALGSRERGAETVAMIGTGNVGAALGRRFAENGHKIVYGSRDPVRRRRSRARRRDGPRRRRRRRRPKPRRAADIVVLAVPWSAAEDVVRALGDLRGKIVVDPTNPRVMASDGFADYPIEDSNAERIARARAGRARRQGVQHARRRDDARPQARGRPRHGADRRRRPRREGARRGAGARDRARGRRRRPAAPRAHHRGAALLARERAAAGASTTTSARPRARLMRHGSRAQSHDRLVPRPGKVRDAS